MSLEPTIAAIRTFHRGRVFAMEQRKRNYLALGAYLRTELGWRRDLPEAERKRFAQQAADLIEIGEQIVKAERKNKPLPEIDEPAFDGLLKDAIIGTVRSNMPFIDIEERAAKEMERLAKSLPVWQWAEGIRGLGARSLAVIVAEAGDLSAYPKKGHLWKRMGLAVLDGVRQGGLPKGASAEDWIAHGYSPRRRSYMFVIGDVMVKMGAEYRQIYLARKEYEKARLPDAKPIVLHRRAQRYMEKRLLRDLWRAWNEQKAAKEMPERAARVLPTAHTQDEAMEELTV